MGPRFPITGGDSPILLARKISVNFGWSRFGQLLARMTDVLRVAGGSEGDHPFLLFPGRAVFLDKLFHGLHN
jgi:hypothetical protein